MKSIIGTAAAFIPLLIPLAAFTGVLRDRKLWFFSLSIYSSVWLSFTFIAFSLYASAGNSVIQGLHLLEATRWSGALFLQWDFLGSLLAWIATTIVLSLHFLSYIHLQKSQALLASIAAFLSCSLVAMGSSDLFLFSMALAGLIFPKFIMICLDDSESRISISMESTIFSCLTLFATLIVVLAIGGAENKIMPEWLSISGKENEVSAGSIGFFLLLISTFFTAGIFPFHATNRKIFNMCRLEAFVPLLIQSVIGFLLLFRFATLYFPDQLKYFSEHLLYFYSFASLFAAIGFWGSDSSRDRIFWLSQVLSCLAAIGFFSMSYKGWHGSSALIVFQALSIPVLLLLSLSLERRDGRLTADSIAIFPWLASSAIIAPLIALCLPLSLGFYCLVLIFWSLFPNYTLAIPVALFAVPICIFSGMRIMFFTLGSKLDRIQQETTHGDLNLSEKAAVLPPLALLLLLGIVPGFLLTPIGASVVLLLKGLRLGF